MSPRTSRLVFYVLAVAVVTVLTLGGLRFQDLLTLRRINKGGHPLGSSSYDRWRLKRVVPALIHQHRYYFEQDSAARRKGRIEVDVFNARITSWNALIDAACNYDRVAWSYVSLHVSSGEAFDDESENFAANGLKRSSEESKGVRPR
jgi:hypothetical protein